MWSHDEKQAPVQAERENREGGGGMRVTPSIGVIAGLAAGVIVNAVAIFQLQSLRSFNAVVDEERVRPLVIRSLPLYVAMLMSRIDDACNCEPDACSLVGYTEAHRKFSGQPIGKTFDEMFYGTAGLDAQNWCDQNRKYPHKCYPAEFYAANPDERWQPCVVGDFE
jgi:hypothetical protein